MRRPRSVLPPVCRVCSAYHHGSRCSGSDRSRAIEREMRLYQRIGEAPRGTDPVSRTLRLALVAVIEMSL